jgi:NAD-dependent deacetylase
MASAVQVFAELIQEANHIAVLSGAGISTPSGIPDFRSEGGLYTQAENVNVFDIVQFEQAPEYFYRFAQAFYPLVVNAEPNTAHKVIAQWEQDGKDVRVATQNIDGLHEEAGSSHVFYLHGNVETSTCTVCGTQFRSKRFATVIERAEVARCGCGGVIKPDIIFFGEMLPEFDWQASADAIANADLLLVVGTSLVVYPAASLPGFRNPRTRLVIVNRDETYLDREADLVIHDDLADVFAAM